VKYLCDSCSRLVDLAQFAVEDEAIVATCPACGAKSRAARAAAAPGVAPPGATPRAVAPKVEPAAVASPPVPMVKRGGAESLRPAERNDETGLPDDLELAWKSLLARWTEEDQHKRFIVLAGAQNALAEVGRRYRVRTEAGDPIADFGRDEVVRHALNLAMVSTPPEQHAAQGATFVVVAVVVAAVIAVLTVLWKALRS
jgi:hypothetical protein